jgi:hypothetical protein
LVDDALVVVSAASGDVANMNKTMKDASFISKRPRSIDRLGDRRRTPSTPL